MELLEFLEVSRFFGKVQQVTGKHCPVKLLTFGLSNKRIWRLDTAFSVVKDYPCGLGTSKTLLFRSHQDIIWPWGVRTLWIQNWLTSFMDKNRAFLSIIEPQLHLSASVLSILLLKHMFELVLDQTAAEGSSKGACGLPRWPYVRPWRAFL